MLDRNELEKSQLIAKKWFSLIDSESLNFAQRRCYSLCIRKYFPEINIPIGVFMRYKRGKKSLLFKPEDNGEVRSLRNCVFRRFCLGKYGRCKAGGMVQPESQNGLPGAPCESKILAGCSDATRILNVLDDCLLFIFRLSIIQHIRLIGGKFYRPIGR